MKGVLGSVSMVKSFSTKSSLKSELMSDSMQKHRSCGPSTFRGQGLQLIPFWVSKAADGQMDRDQPHHRGAGRCSRRVQNVVLDFCVVRRGGCGMEGLAGRQRGQRQNQLLTGRREHHVIVERDFLEQLHL